MGINVGGLNPFQIQNNGGIVSNAEIESISKEIFGAAKAGSVQNAELPQINLAKAIKPETGLNLFATDVNTANQVAKTNVGLDVKLSNNALANLQSLRAEAAKAQAATTQTTTVFKNVEGKLYIPAENAETINLKEIFAASNAPQVFNTDNLDKDRKGSSPFTFTKGQNKESQEKEESLSIFA